MTEETVEQVEVSDAAPVAEETISETSADESVSSETQAEDNSFEEFDWAGWEGDMDLIPEKVRPWAQKVYDSRQGWVENQIGQSESEIGRLKNLYESLVSGFDDPRLDEMQTSLSSWETKYNDLQTKYDEATAQHVEYKSAIEAAVEAEANDYADKFQKKHAEIFNDPQKATLFAQLVEEGWDFELAPSLMNLTEAQLNTAREAKQNGVPDAYALKLIEGAVKRKPEPRPGAQITAGATSPAVPPNQVKDETASAKSFDEIRNIAARSALKHHSGRR